MKQAKTKQAKTKQAKTFEVVLSGEPRKGRVSVFEFSFGIFTRKHAAHRCASRLHNQFGGVVRIIPIVDGARRLDEAERVR